MHRRTDAIGNTLIRAATKTDTGGQQQIQILAVGMDRVNTKVELKICL